MRKVILILISLSFGCQKKEIGYSIPSFKENFALKGEGFLESIAKENDFSVAYTISDIWSVESSMKIFTVKNNVWQKIELRKGILELDSTLTNVKITMPTDVRGVDTTFVGNTVDVVVKEIKLKKECRKEEAEYFLNQLISLKLFELDEEEKLLEKCGQQREDKTAPQYTDVPYVNFYIIKGNNVRLVSYQTFKRKEDCPQVKEWENINELMKLFEKEWYVKKHY